MEAYACDARYNRVFPNGSVGGRLSRNMTDVSNKRAPVILLIAFLFLVNLGCKEPPTWTTETHSPDGAWTATARTFEYSGFGTGGVETIVEIRRDRQSPERVLAFAEGGQDMALNLHWDDSHHLAVTYHGAPELLYYQVVKTSGVDISIQDISSPNDFHPSARP